MELKGKVAIVTGAGQGIGEATSLELGKAGANLVLADIREDTMAKVKKEIEGMGREALAIRMDVAKWPEAENMAKSVMERFGRIDILVNNAGISPKPKDGTRLTVVDIEEQEWDRVMNVNLKGVFNCSKAVIPFMMKQRFGKIVNVGSIVGITGGPITPAGDHYCVSKAGVICLTKVMAINLGPYNINVNCVAPGRITGVMFDTSSPEIREAILKQTPLRKFGEPIDVARTILFLVSEAAHFITGETTVVDGGRTLH